MARNYAVSGNNATGKATTASTMIQLYTHTTARAWIFDITMGSPIAPADYTQVFDLKRLTANGTGTSYTPQILDDINIASVLTGSTTTGTWINGSAEPTYSGTTDTVISLLVVPLNARATFRYVASPGAEFVNHLVSGTGFGFRQSCTTAQQGNATVLYFE